MMEASGGVKRNLSPKAGSEGTEERDPQGVRGRNLRESRLVALIFSGRWLGRPRSEGILALSLLLPANWRRQPAPCGPLDCGQDER